MNLIKISLHDAKPSRYPEPSTVFTWNERHSSNEQVMRKMTVSMERTEPIVPGWRQELEILTPTTTFGTFPEMPSLKAGEVIQWWTPPPHPEQLSFHFYIGDAESRLDSISDHVGDVCQMQLSSGRKLWIVAQSTPMTELVAEDIGKHVASLPAGPKLIHPFTLRKLPNRAPILLDLAATYHPAS
jgi:hypothetical protein